MNQPKVKIKAVTNTDGNLYYTTDVSGSPFSCTASQDEFNEYIVEYGTVVPLIQKMHLEFEAMGAKV